MYNINFNVTTLSLPFVFSIETINATIFEENLRTKSEELSKSLVTKFAGFLHIVRELKRDTMKVKLATEGESGKIRARELTRSFFFHSLFLSLFLSLSEKNCASANNYCAHARQMTPPVKPPAATRVINCFRTGPARERERERYIYIETERSSLFLSSPSRRREAAALLRIYRCVRVSRGR